MSKSYVRERASALKLALTSITISFLLSGCVETVPYVDLERYMGLWYQVAANDTEFSGDLVGVTAEYELQEDGTVSVYNKGLQGSLSGPVEDIRGTATVWDSETNSKLKVNFPTSGMPNLPYPNYLIVVLDDTNYQYAVVTDPNQITLFVLSRTKQMDAATYESILAMLEAKDVDTSGLIITPQVEGEPTIY